MDNVQEPEGVGETHHLRRKSSVAVTKKSRKASLKEPTNLSHLPDDTLLAKRFPAKQKNKIRPIDDYNANVVKHCVTPLEGVTVLLIM